MRNKRLLGLGILLIFQLAFPLYFIFLKEGIHDKGKEFLFPIAPVDPYDFFQGKYVDLNAGTISYSGAKAKEFKRKDVVYVTLEQTKNRIKITDVSKKRTAFSLKLVVLKKEKGNILYFRLPFERFYTEESKAKQIERTISSLDNSDSIRPYVHVKIYQGDYMIVDISKNGQSLVNSQ